MIIFVLISKIEKLTEYIYVPIGINEKNTYILEFLAIFSPMDTYAPVDYNNAYYYYHNSFAANGYDYYEYIELRTGNW